MLESTSTSRRPWAFCVAALLTILLLSLPARAAGYGSPPPTTAPPETPAATGEKVDRTAQPEDEDFSSTPFTEYAEFNEAQEEEENARFFQYGRFFGVSLGAGFEGVTGNRGLLWQGGFPLADFRIHYWFDFNFALRLGLQAASHYYETTNKGHVDISTVFLGVDLAYYFVTKDLSSALSFGNPYLLMGGGTMAKTETSALDQTVATDNALAIELGGGLEFALKPRKAYFQFEGKYRFVTFKDTNTTVFQASNNLPNLSGGFYTFTGSILFTW